MARRRQGAGVVEFALGLPVLLLLGMGVLEWGWALRAQTKVISAAREGARAGSGTDQDQAPEAEAIAWARMELDNAGFDGQAATIEATQVGTAPDVVMTVAVSLPYTPLVSLVPTLDTISASTTMHMWDQP